MSQDYMRPLRLIRTAIAKTRLDLTGLHVLTEVASNHFLYTPIIAALAGARKVFAWTKDTPYGLGVEIQQQCRELVKAARIDKDVITVRVNERPEADVAAADIVTNLGMVRPIDEVFIKMMKENAVIPYMCEAWEVRQGDVDFKAAKAKGIKIAGTFENHSSLKIFDGIGPLCVKLAQEAGFEVYQNRIAVLSKDHFGTVAAQTFLAFGAETATVITPENLSSLTDTSFDFALVADYTTDTDYLADNSPIVQMRLPVVHLAGNVSIQKAEEGRLMVYPKQQGHAKRMTQTLAYLGPKSVIDLHTAGLKVGEFLHYGITNQLVQPVC